MLSLVDSFGLPLPFFLELVFEIRAPLCRPSSRGNYKHIAGDRLEEIYSRSLNKETS